jgi:hypothetical protein
MKSIKFLSILFIATITLSSCSKNDEPEPVNEEEVITTVTVTLTNGSNTVTLQSKDLDGDGPNAPVVTVSGNLAANTTYTGAVVLLNETENPAEDITAEVRTEGDEHQLFYSATNNIATFAYTDKDSNNDPIGLAFTLTTGAAGTGTIGVILRHEPNKSATGVSNGDITNAGGSTDVDVSFNVTVQ